MISFAQDQTERDMMEFVNFSIDGFLNDLNLVVGSYSAMFFNNNTSSNER